MQYNSDKKRIIDQQHSLPGRTTSLNVSGVHLISGNKMTPPFPQETQQAVFALGCFWGAERKFWLLDGVLATAVGYTAGYTPNPTYEEVCSGFTAHTEAVLVSYNPMKISYKNLLKVFWESHNPTQSMQQGNDVGTQYRSGIYCYGEEQHALAITSKTHYQTALSVKNFGAITTEIKLLSEFYYAEEYHQQYLAKNPNGYCGLGGCGVKFSNEY